MQSARNEDGSVNINISGEQLRILVGTLGYMCYGQRPADFHLLIGTSPDKAEHLAACLLDFENSYDGTSTGPDAHSVAMPIAQNEDGPLTLKISREQLGIIVGILGSMCHGSAAWEFHTLIGVSSVKGQHLFDTLVDMIARPVVAGLSGRIPRSRRGR